MSGQNLRICTIGTPWITHYHGGKRDLSNRYIFCMPDESTIGDLVTLTRLGLVTVLLWMGSRIWELWRKHVQTCNDQAAFLRALFAEVDFNTRDMTRFLKTAPTLARFEELFGNPDYVPHVTDARHTDIYRSPLMELHFLEDGLIADLVRFYGDLENVRTQIDGLQHASFLKISRKGKVGTIRNLYDTCAKCEKLGIRILGNMGTRYRSINLQDRSPSDDERFVDSDETLSARLNALQSGLDRVRARHHRK